MTKSFGYNFYLQAKLHKQASMYKAADWRPAVYGTAAGLGSTALAYWLSGLLDKDDKHRTARLVGSGVLGSLVGLSVGGAVKGGAKSSQRYPTTKDETPKTETKVSKAKAEAPEAKSPSSVPQISDADVAHNVKLFYDGDRRAAAAKQALAEASARLKRYSSADIKHAKQHLNYKLEQIKPLQQQIAAYKDKQAQLARMRAADERDFTAEAALEGEIKAQAKDIAQAKHTVDNTINGIETNDLQKALTNYQKALESYTPIKNEMALASDPVYYRSFLRNSMPQYRFDLPTLKTRLVGGRYLDPFKNRNVWDTKL